MRIETTYFADDDTEFDTEEECLAYERGLKENMKAVMFFNENVEPLESSDPSEIASYAFYIYVKDSEKAKDLFDWLEEWAGMELEGVEDFKTGDIFRYDDRRDWINMRKEINMIQGDINMIKERMSENG